MTARATDDGDARRAGAGIYVAVCGTCGLAACTEPVKPGVKRADCGRALHIDRDEHVEVLRASCNDRPLCSGRGSRWVLFRRAEL